MLKLLTNCEVYAPLHLGRLDILLAGGHIMEMAAGLGERYAQTTIQKEDIDGACVCPGLVDSHVHITGGGGEMGPASRMPELQLEDFALNGVTSVLGLLGTDGVSRSLENLLFKCRALAAQGMTTRMLTGSYAYPSKTLTGSIQRDLCLVEQVIGVKIAISDHRGAAVSAAELARVMADARVGGMLSGKPGITVMHLGASHKMLTPAFDALTLSDVPAGNLVPTHCERSEALIRQAVRLQQMGGTMDFTADSLDSEGGVAASLQLALNEGAEPGRITISSDAGGSQPVFDEKGRCVRIDTATSETLLGELRRLVFGHGMALGDALQFFTSNPARVMGIADTAGVLKPGADADILVLDKALAVRHLYLKGRRIVRDGQLNETA